MSLAALVVSLVQAAASPRLAANPDAQAALVSGVSSALGEATCSEQWSGVDDCRPVWPAARVRELAALVVTVGRYESGLDPRIGATRCRLDAGECDPKGPKGQRYAGSLGYFQVGRFLLTRHELREVLSGAGEWSVYLQARTAIRALVGAAGACRGVSSEFRAAFSGYATGGQSLSGRCFWRDAAKREATARWLLSAVAARD